MPDGDSVTVGIERLHLEQDAGKSLHDQHPTMSFVDLNRSGVALMEIVSKPDMRSAERGQGLSSTKLRGILRYLGTCDGDMEKGNLRADVNVSVRRPGESARHALRDQERELDPLHRPGDRVRGAAPDRHPRGRRHDRAGDAALRSRHATRPARCATRKRRTTTAISPIPTCCRSNSREAYVEALQARAAGTAGPEEGALHRRASACRLRCRRAGRRARERGFLRGRAGAAGRHGARRQARRQLGDQRAVRPPQQGRPGHRGLAGLGGAARRDPRPDRRGHHLRQDRQGPVRDRLAAKAAIRARSSRRAA